MLKASSLLGSMLTWYCFWNPPMEATSATPGNGLELVAEIPVLEAPQLGQIVLAGLVHQGVLIDPAHARGVRA